MDSKKLETVKFQKLHEDAVIPYRATEGAAGYDLISIDDSTLQVGEMARIRTGIAVKCPQGTYGRIAETSGNTWKKGVRVGAGVCDEDYRGELMVIVFNQHPTNPARIEKGKKIAQLIFEKILTPEVEEVDELPTTERGVGGFGSTGN